MKGKNLEDLLNKKVKVTTFEQENMILGLLRKSPSPYILLSFHYHSSNYSGLLLELETEKEDKDKIIKQLQEGTITKEQYDQKVKELEASIEKTKDDGIKKGIIDKYYKDFKIIRLFQFLRCYRLCPLVQTHLVYCQKNEDYFFVTLQNLLLNL